MIMNPSINIGGTSALSMVQDRIALLNAIEKVMEAMQATKPHGRDYVGRAYQYDLDRAIYADRFNVLDKLRNEIQDEALEIQSRPR